MKRRRLMITVAVVAAIVVLVVMAWSAISDDFRDAFNNAASGTCTHDFGAWSTTTQPTCTAEGTQTRTCKVSSCPHSETRSVDARGHNWNAGTQKTAATCTAPAVHTFTCMRSGCNHAKDESVGAALGHDWEEGECTVCGDVSEE